MNSTETSRPSRAAILSFVFGIVLWFLWCALYGTLGIMAENNSLSETAGYAGFFNWANDFGRYYTWTGDCRRSPWDSSCA